MYRKASVRTVPLTPDLAAQFAGMPPLPGERSLRMTRWNYLAAQLLRNKFSGPDWAEGLCKATGITYRLDGQHSSNLLANLPSGAQFPSNLLATITHYEFDSMADAADVFNLFNNPRSVRNNVDMMGTYAAQMSGLENYSREFLVDIANGIYEHERKRQSAKEADALLFAPRDRGMYFMVSRPEFLAYTHWLARFREQKNAHFLHRSVIVGEMIAHRVISPVDADTFWELVFSEMHPDPDHETRVLAEWFREQLAVAAKPKLDMQAFRKRAHRAWRQFRTSEKAA